jgi:hypothetical protein
MKNIKKIGHWIAFLIGGFFGTNLALTIVTFLPFYLFIWLFNFSDFWFFMIGSILAALYYYLIFGGLLFYFSFLNKRKPDYWISNIFIVLVTILFVYNLINLSANASEQTRKLFFTFKGIVFFCTIIPAFFQIFYLSLIAQFVRDEWN